MRLSKNSNIPCLPGFLPVTKETQAVGVIGGIVVSKEALAPPAIIRSRLGSPISRINGSSRSNVVPSKPRKNNFLLINQTNTKIKSVWSSVLGTHMPS